MNMVSAFDRVTLANVHVRIAFSLMFALSFLHTPADLLCRAPFAQRNVVVVQVPPQIILLVLAHFAVGVRRTLQHMLL
jgi:hypothetical protein